MIFLSISPILHIYKFFHTSSKEIIHSPEHQAHHQCWVMVQYGANQSNSVTNSYFIFQELQDIRSSGIKVFRDIQVDESNILSWTGLIVPVSMLTCLLLSICKDHRGNYIKCIYIITKILLSVSLFVNIWYKILSLLYTTKNTKYEVKPSVMILMIIMNDR